VQPALLAGRAKCGVYFDKKIPRHTQQRIFFIHFQVFILEEWSVSTFPEINISIFLQFLPVFIHRKYVAHLPVAWQSQSLRKRSW